MKIRDTHEERDTWYRFGLEKFKAGEVDAALRCFEFALQLDPTFSEAALKRDEVLLESGMVSKSIKRYYPCDDPSERITELEKPEDPIAPTCSSPLNPRLKTAEKVLRYLLNNKQFKDKIAHIEKIPPHEPLYGDVSPPLPEPLTLYLRQQNIRLYTHQCDAIQRIREGEHIILTTPTASGKTLAFNIPIFELLLKHPRATALYIYPIKALANDQYKTLKEFEQATRIVVNASRYDGDTPSDERGRIRCSSKIILTNPYELHYMLGSHDKWVSFFAHLKCIVIDEAHTYRGVFGSNVALIVRRLRRICALYGAKPQFILSSATIANPEEFAEKLIGHPVAHISRDGSPRGSKFFVLYNPENETAKGDTVTLSTHNETAKILTACVTMEVQTLCFTRSRQLVELIALWTKEALQDDYPRLARRVQSYRGGYLPEDRLQIEQKIKDGYLLGIVSTNALELGIDIGSLDCVILSGYPGTMMSTWQQAGRAGRRATESVAIMVAFSNPLEQHFIRHPEDFFTRPHENAVLDLENRYIRANHLLCAAQEIALDVHHDKQFFEGNLGEVLEELNAQGDLASTESGWVYAGSETWIHGAIKLNSISSDSFRLMYGHRLLERLDFTQAFREAHPGAVFLHNSQPHLVEDFDLKNMVIKIRQEDVDYYTKAVKGVSLSVIHSSSQAQLNSIDLCTGTVRISETYTCYRIIRHEKVIGEEPLDLPPLQFETKATWFTIPFSVQEMGFTSVEEFEKGLRGLENVIPTVLPYFILCDAYDVSVHAEYLATVTGKPTVFIYDNYEGGIGLSEKVAELLCEILTMSYRLIKDCRCEGGCPSCIYTNSYTNESEVDKNATLVLLKRVSDALKQADNMIS